MKRLALAVFYTIRFALELLLLGAFGYWASRLELLPQVRWLLGIAVVATAAAVWGVFVSPKARVRLGEGARLTVELCIIAAAVVALRSAGRVREALLLAVAAVVIAVVNSLLRRTSGMSPVEPLVRRR